jgi:hypothetical protein
MMIVPILESRHVNTDSMITSSRRWLSVYIDEIETLASLLQFVKRHNGFGFHLGDAGAIRFGVAVESLLDQGRFGSSRFSMPPRNVSMQVMTACGKNSTKKTAERPSHDPISSMCLVRSRRGSKMPHHFGKLGDVQSEVKSLPMNQRWISRGSSMGFPFHRRG